MSDALDYLNYNDMVNENCTKELLTSDKWDVTFARKPAAVYWPGDQFMKFRLRSLSGLDTTAFFESPLAPTPIRGFALPSQPGMVELKEQTISFSMVDFEDQSLLVFFTDWAFKCCDPVTKKGFRAQDLRADMVYTRLNVLNQPVREYKQVNAIISNYSYDEPFEDSRSLVGDNVSYDLIGVVLPPKFLNLA